MNTIKNTKNILYILLGIAVILAIGYGINRSLESKKSSGLSLQEILQLEEEQRKEALVNEENNLKSEAEKLTENAEAGTKYSIYIRLAELQIALEQYDEAMNSLNAIPEERKNNTRIFTNYTKVYQGKGDIVLAKENAEKVITMDDELADGWVLKLGLNQDLPQDQLKALYLQAIEKTKSNLEVMVSYAKFSERIGDKATAIAAWETAINVDSANEAKYREEITRLRQ